MDENLCKYWSCLCFRGHEDCRGCVVFWGNGGLRMSDEELEARARARQAPNVRVSKVGTDFEIFKKFIVYVFSELKPYMGLNTR